ncbi:hypothetical protein [Streptomyces sp. IMTB 2501]|uniref:hypothetical protein n=1 Tax=Streptomyces sp. IMTB 2501 TaxID=1776340 RepID=UPI0015BFD487|nr:hypothetical protein [Streptomyces sp. IMTB 2501]
MPWAGEHMGFGLGVGALGVGRREERAVLRYPVVELGRCHEERSGTRRVVRGRLRAGLPCCAGTATRIARARPHNGADAAPSARAGPNSSRLPTARLVRSTPDPSTATVTPDPVPGFQTDSAFIGAEAVSGETWPKGGRTHPAWPRC